MNEAPTLFQVIGIMVVVMACIALLISYLLMVKAVLDSETNILKIIEYINKRDPLAKLDAPKVEEEKKE